MAQSSKPQPKPDEAQTASKAGAADDVILDAEIISEQARPTRAQAPNSGAAKGDADVSGAGVSGAGVSPDTLNQSTKSQPNQHTSQTSNLQPNTKPKVSLLTRAALTLCGLLAAFIGGLFAEPYVHTSLVRLGLIEAGQESGAGTGSESLKAEIESTQATLAEQKRLASTLVLRVSALEGAHADLSGTSGLPSGQLDAASIDTLISRLSDLEDRFSQMASPAPRTSAGSVPNAGAIGSPDSGVSLPSVTTVEAAAFDRLSGDFETSRAGFQAALADFSTRLSELEAANSAANARVTQTQGALASAEARVPALAARQAGLEATTRQLASEQSALSARLTRLEGQAASLAGGSLANSASGRLVLMLTDVRQRAVSGQPVASDLAAMQALVSQLTPLQQARVEPVLDSLGALLAAPLASQADLVDHYDATLKAASDARAAREGAFLAGLLRVRRTGAAAEGFDKIVAEARMHLAAGRHAQARDTLAALKAEDLADFSNWLKSLDRHISAELMFARVADLLARSEVDARGGSTPASIPSGDAEAEAGRDETTIDATPDTAVGGTDTPTSPQGEH